MRQAIVRWSVLRFGAPMAAFSALATAWTESHRAFWSRAFLLHLGLGIIVALPMAWLSGWLFGTGLWACGFRPDFREKS